MKILRYYLSKSEMTRRGEKLERTQKIAIYKVKSNKTALEYRLYIENLKKQDDLYFSVHYIVDSNGNVVNIIPEKEVSIHDGEDLHINYITISILVLEDEKGGYSHDEVNNLLEKLVKKYSLDIDKDVIIKDTNSLG